MSHYIVALQHGTAAPRFLSQANQAGRDLRSFRLAGERGWKILDFADDIAAQRECHMANEQIVKAGDGAGITRARPYSRVQLEAIWPGLLELLTHQAGLPS